VLSLSDSRSCLVALSKRPKLGQGKQRLAADIGVDAAQNIAEVLIDCVMDDLSSWPNPSVFAVADEDDLAWGHELCAQKRLSRTQCWFQAEGNLGERIMELDQACLDEGYAKRIYIGSDAPQLDLAHFLEVESRLDEADVVLIPAKDGGVVLMATRHKWPNLSDLPWSTDTLRVALVDTCSKHNLLVHELDPLSDLDDVNDLTNYREILKSDIRISRQNLLRKIDVFFSNHQK